MDPHNHSQKPAGELAQCLPAAGHRPRFPLSLGSRRSLKAAAVRGVTARLAARRDGGGEEGTQPLSGGPRAGDARVPAGALRGPRPTRAGPSHAGAAALLPVPGAGIQAGTHPGRTHRRPHPPQPRTHRGRRSRRTARFPAAAAAPGGPSAAPWPWLAMPGPGPGGGWERPPRRARAPRRPPAAAPAPSWAASARAPVPHSCRPARSCRRSCRRRGCRACAGAGPRAQRALWPERPAGGPQRRGR